MIENYTRAANSRCFDLIDADLSAIWEDIENTPEGTSSERWRMKLDRIAREYVLSSRFALMRIVCARACGCSPSDSESQPGFAVRLDGGRTYSFESLHQYLRQSELLDMLEQFAAGEEQQQLKLMDELCRYEQDPDFQTLINPEGIQWKKMLYSLLSDADDEREETEKLRRLAEPVRKRVSDVLEEEREKYLTVLLDIAQRQADAEINRTEAEILCRRAMRDVNGLARLYLSQPGAEDTGKQSTEKKKAAKAAKRAAGDCGRLLTREEALKLGHFLDFTLEEMSWFLLRVFDYEDGFRFNASGDLIEAYGFLTGSSWQTVRGWQSAYQKMARSIPKADGDALRTLDWTQSMEDSLPRLAEKWARTPDRCEQYFMDWLRAQAPFLDLPSRTATQIYRALAVCAYRLIRDEIDIPDSTALCDRMKDLCRGKYETDTETALFEHGVISSAKCQSVSGVLLKENKEQFTFEPDAAKAWRTITTNEKGQPRLTMAGRPDAGRTRMPQLLHGALQVEKGDMLYLLWFVFSLYWLEHPVSDVSEMYNSLADYCEAAETVLDAARLPGFYPPHMLEQSMMLSIVLSNTETGNPADIYAEVCESLIKPRKGRSERSAAN